MVGQRYLDCDFVIKPMVKLLFFDFLLFLLNDLISQLQILPVTVVIEAKE